MCGVMFRFEMCVDWSGFVRFCIYVCYLLLRDGPHFLLTSLKETEMKPILFLLDITRSRPTERFLSFFRCVLDTFDLSYAGLGS